MWRQLPGVQKPRQVSRGKQYRESGLLVMPGVASLHVGVAGGPGGSRPGIEGGPLAEVPGAGWKLEQVKVERIQAKVKVKRNQARMLTWMGWKLAPSRLGEAPGNDITQPKGAVKHGRHKRQRAR